jgi:hypothetical protein
MAAATQLADVVDERARVTEREAAPFVEGGQRVARARLVGVAAIVLAENVFKVVFRMLRVAPVIGAVEFQAD